MKTFIFFTLNDFTKDGGGTIRMKAIVNSLAKKDKKVILFSNAQSTSGFDKNIKHISIGEVFTKNDKRRFQLLLTLLPFSLFKLIYRKFFNKINKLFLKNKISSPIIFFEHLDNSIGYALHKHKILSQYINDTHGIAVMEFLYKSTTSYPQKATNYIKAFFANRLDRKVFTSAYGLIFVSHAMKNYFFKRSLIKTDKILILRDGVNENLCHSIVNNTKVKELKNKFQLTAVNKVVFFAGNFKDLGGVLDLLQAFLYLVKWGEMKGLRLLLLGDGECYNTAISFVNKHQLNNVVIFVGRTDHNELRNYQELADIIVCPDKQHPFSELVPHIKYFDSLASGKVVINGSFASVKEINIDEKFSIDFQPSNILDLANKITMAMQNIEYYKEKYKNNKTIICSQYSYKNFIEDLISFMEENIW